MRLLITGANGQLGHALQDLLVDSEIDFIVTSKEDFDLTDNIEIPLFIKHIKPSMVIHCAAYNNVEKAEEDQAVCMQINFEATKAIAKACQDIDATLLYVSTDYVFNGKKMIPYDVDDQVDPLSLYGVSKAKGEEAVRSLCKKHFIVRTSWLFGDGENFVKTILQLITKRDKISVVCDQIGSPTYAPDLAKLLLKIIETDFYGTYHATNEGSCSWADFAEAIIKLAGSSTEIERIRAEEYSSKAKRPLNSQLSKRSLDEKGFARLPHWTDALRRCLMQPNIIKNVEEYYGNSTF